MKAIVGGCCFVMGLALMGSDGPWFPYANIIGAVIFALLIPLSNSIDLSTKEERKWF